MNKNPLDIIEEATQIEKERYYSNALTVTFDISDDNVRGLVNGILEGHGFKEWGGGNCIPLNTFILNIDGRAYLDVLVELKTEINDILNDERVNFTPDEKTRFMFSTGNVNTWKY